MQGGTATHWLEGETPDVTELAKLHLNLQFPANV